MRITHKETYPKFRVGDRVRAVSGWAKGRIGTIVDINLFSVRWDGMDFRSFSYVYTPDKLEHLDEFAVWVRETRHAAGLD